MIDWTSAGPPALAAFMASMVEFVEALTIVLAVGVVRGWRSALLGAAAGGLLLAALVLALGQTLTRISLPALQLVVGVLLLMFGLRWLRKAILRSAGVLPLHDEAEAFARETQAMRRQHVVREAVDKVAFIAAFKAVVLEGIEVVFIVIALGAGGHLVPAAAGAASALAVVIVLGFLLHRPLANVPENSLKFGVGVMLAAFGTFWVGEGIGLEWPGRDGAILALIAAFLSAAVALVFLCKQLRPAIRRIETKAAGSPVPAKTGALAGVWAELFGLFVDDGWLAAGIVVWLVTAWTFPALHLPSAQLAVAFTIGLLAVLALSAIRRARL